MDQRPHRVVEQHADDHGGYGDDWPAEDEYSSPQPLSKGRWIAAAAVLVVLAAGGGVIAGRAGTAGGIQWLSAPLAGAAAPTLVSLGVDGPQPVQSELASKIESLLADSRLGGRVTASVVDVVSGEELFDKSGSIPVVPASTAKLLTAAAVLQARGPAHRIPTQAVAGSSPGEVVLVGGGDPTLAASATATYPGAARLDLLAAQVLDNLDGQVPERVIVDTSLYEGSTLGPGWYAGDLDDGYIAHITAVMTDGARKNPKRLGATARYPQPDLAAGQIFAKALGLPGSAVSFGTAPGGAQQLGEVLSPPISRLVEIMLAESDNILAEGLARQVAIARDRPASFVEAAAATRDVLAELGLPMEGFGLVDGSGLSHRNKVNASLLARVLSLAASAEHPRLRSVLSGLPVAGYSGTLGSRFGSANSGGPAAGVVRAKTGTLSRVNSLAGLVVDADGRLLAFSILADQTKRSDLAEAALDRVAAAIAACGCS